MACGIPAAFEIQKEELLNSCLSCLTVTPPLWGRHALSFLQEGQEIRRRSRLAGMACGIPAAFEIQKEELLNSCPSCVTVTSPFGATHTEFLNRRDRRSGDDLFRSRLTARLRPLRGELFGVHCRMVQTFQA